MAETIAITPFGLRWSPYNAYCDLKNQAGVDVSIETATRLGGQGVFRGIKFSYSWEKDNFLVVTMDEHMQDLVDAFAKVLEYEPFCRYQMKGIHVVEWEKEEPGLRYFGLEELLEGGYLSDLLTLTEFEKYTTIKNPPLSLI